FGVEGLEASDVALILDDSFDIAVRAGLHCAPYTHRRFGTFPSGAVRVSVGPLTTENEMGQLIEALGEIVG
ncbi:MAG: aminotransferase class V-fold PLP-dependent enzyme, partial [Algisphaera sp.]